MTTQTTVQTVEKVDVYQRVTDAIVTMLEAGANAGDYRTPWHTGKGKGGTGQGLQMPVNVVSKRWYRGVNVLVLWSVGAERGYQSNVWGTFKQWQGKGGCVRKGEKGTHIVYWQFLDAKPGKGEGDNGDDGETAGAGAGTGKGRKIPMLKSYVVFNRDQVAGLPAIDVPVVEGEGDGLGDAGDATTPIEPNEGAMVWDARVQRLEAEHGLELRHTATPRAYYSPVNDYVHMPLQEMFRGDGVGYHAVLAHELTHWTAHQSRLDRNLTGRFGSESYAMEELVAELGAAFVCAVYGIDNQPRVDHAQYIDSWLKVLKGDKRAIFGAMSHAQKAVDWLIGDAGQGEGEGMEGNTGKGE